MTGMKQSRASGEWTPREPRSGQRRWLREPGAIVFLMALCALIPFEAVAQTSSAGEYELKAAMLYRLTYFVEWPATAAPDSQGATILCVLGQDPVGTALPSVISGQSGSARRVEVRHPRNAGESGGCQVVYVAASEKKNMAQILATLKLKGSGVLTVGDMAQFAAKGGMIQFSLDESHVRFDINLDEATQAGLKISSRVLMLARIVKAADKPTAATHEAAQGKSEP